ncbi:MAG: hypothetical protein H0T84_04360 [Tatlockia sp.]|nr:hypothetical protein [Tatlockia sp.]
MKLSRSEKHEFLQECFKHILRINSELINGPYPPSLTIDSGFSNRLNSNLPKSIKLISSTVVRPLGLVKLEALVGIYNNVAVEANNNNPYNLKPLFKEIKSQINQSLNDYDPLLYKNPDANYIMNSHRTKTGNALLDWILNLFKPSSASFLGQYGFFDKPSKFSESKEGLSSIPQAYTADDINP